jgi:hypothetical protein
MADPALPAQIVVGRVFIAPGCSGIDYFCHKKPAAKPKETKQYQSDVTNSFIIKKQSENDQ